MATDAPIKPVGTARIVFRDEGEQARDDDPVAVELSAAAYSDGYLWLGSDELSHVERLTRLPNGDFGRHRYFSIGDFIDLPEDEDSEMDIEGLDIDGGYLWVVGSHSKTRGKPKPTKYDAETVLERLSAVKNTANRYFLGRVPLVAHGDNGVELAKSADKGSRKAGALPFFKKHGNALTRFLRKDEHIGPFVGLPAKENGFDVEGVAVRGDQIFLGLRGPVLRGWAIILELRVWQAKKGKLKMAPVDASGDRVRKHFIHLGGLGIRELCFQGDDLLILAGPTMDLDGPVRLLRWWRALAATTSHVVPETEIGVVCDLPVGDGNDHAEGLAWVPHGKGQALLVVYDTPKPARLDKNARVTTADLFAITRRKR